MKNKIFRIVFFLFIAGILPGKAGAQVFNKLKMDSLFDILGEKNKAMGSLAITQNGKLLYSRSFGDSFRSATEKREANRETNYRVGSVSKMFTAVLIFQLIEEGKLTLATTLKTYFPEIPHASAITIAHLLNHRSGVHDFTRNKDCGDWMTQPRTKTEMLAVISGSPADFQPGEKMEYSNSNYVLLGYIIEKICRQTYAQSLNERITSKIGLSRTYVGGKIQTAQNESLSYVFEQGWKPLPQTDMSIPGGAGTVVSNPVDLARFMEALFDLKLVSKASLEKMKTITDRSGMGLFPMPFYSRQGYGHNGNIDGFASSVAFFPSDGLAVACCLNGQVYPINDLMIGVLSICFGMDYTIPVFKVLTLTSEDLDKYWGLYASKQLPLKMAVTKNGTILMAQATGQAAFPLEAFGKDQFRYVPAGIVMEFNTSRGEMILKQGGGIFLFTKDK